MLTNISRHLELIVWPTALLLLYLMPVEAEHFSLCPLNALGIAWCPGCGLGHSIHYYLHFDFTQGWDEHYLGAFAAIIILYRTFQLLKNTFKQNSFSHGQQNV